MVYLITDRKSDGDVIQGRVLGVVIFRDVLVNYVGQVLLHKMDVPVITQNKALEHVRVDVFALVDGSRVSNRVGLSERQRRVAIGIF